MPVQVGWASVLPRTRPACGRVPNSTGICRVSGSARALGQHAGRRSGRQIPLLFRSRGLMREATQKTSNQHWYLCFRCSVLVPPNGGYQCCFAVPRLRRCAASTCVNRIGFRRFGSSGGGASDAVVAAQIAVASAVPLCRAQGNRDAGGLAQHWYLRFAELLGRPSREQKSQIPVLFRSTLSVCLPMQGDTKTLLPAAFCDRAVLSTACFLLSGVRSERRIPMLFRDFGGLRRFDAGNAKQHWYL